MCESEPQVLLIICVFIAFDMKNLPTPGIAQNISTRQVCSNKRSLSVHTTPICVLGKNSYSDTCRVSAGRPIE